MSRMCKIRPNCNGTSCDGHLIYSFPVEPRTLDRDIVGSTGSARRRASQNLGSPTSVADHGNIPLQRHGAQRTWQTLRTDCEEKSAAWARCPTYKTTLQYALDSRTARSCGQHSSTSTVSYHVQYGPLDVCDTRPPGRVCKMDRAIRGGMSSPYASLVCLQFPMELW